MIRLGVFFLMGLLSFWTASGSLAASAEGERSFRYGSLETAVPSQDRTLRGILTIHMWKMTEAVGLREEQAAQLFPKIREAFETQWRSEVKRRHLLRLLQAVTEADPPQKQRVDQLLSQWEENEATLHDAQQEMQEAVRKVLTPVQQIKYLLFQERFQGELVRVIQDFRRDQAQGRAKQQPSKER